MLAAGSMSIQVRRRCQPQLNYAMTLGSFDLTVLLKQFANYFIIAWLLALCYARVQVLGLKDHAADEEC